MLNNVIILLKNNWLNSNECTIKSIINYIKNKQTLRESQIEAIEIYLFLKIKGNNKPLWQLFSDGFFNEKVSGSIQTNLEKTKNGVKKLALYQFAKKELPLLATNIEQTPDAIDYDSIIKKMFYSVSYSDYLLSLPMGAGKTYLMASLIYLELYFAINEPNNKNFAHNFLVLIPSGLKNSITASLKTIANFDGSWVLPQSQADKIKHQLRFDILDEAKIAKKSNLTTNPNVAKINNVLPNTFGQIFVVNAEKVIINSKASGMFADLAIPNELRTKLAEVPNLAIYIDEVHHAANDDIKLRQVVSWWNKQGNIATVLGFSGTPYLAKNEKIIIDSNLSFKFSSITNTVYYYPLTTAIEKFLKRPTVKSADLTKTQILTNAIQDFNNLYKNTVYADGTIAKCAIFCSSIADLEEVVYPHLISALRIPKSEVLKFHKGNKDYKLPAANELEFRSLDLASSNKRYILLVQVGKEGWDCKSLTSVVLSGTGDSPKNMVLQSSCRCLRQVDDNDNTALIWLNSANATILNTQLQKEQGSSIDEINQLARTGLKNDIPRISRMKQLQLSNIDFYQLRIKYTATYIKKNADTKNKLQTILTNIATYIKTSITYQGELINPQQSLQTITFIKGDNLSFANWLFLLVKNSFLALSFANLVPYKKQLLKIYNSITKNGFLNDLVDFYLLNNDIALTFAIKRELHSKSEVIKQNVSMLIEQKLTKVVDNPKLYPTKTGIKQILIADNDKAYEQNFAQAKQAKITQLTKDGKYQEVATLAQEELSNAVKNKDRSFHYLPYDFKQSAFEKDILQNTLKLDKTAKLEVYYNGERGLTGFVIECYKNYNNRYQYLGKYTPDFLMLSRNNSKDITKVLILETKGTGYANDTVFIAKKDFVNGDFIASNNKKFGYNKFDFLYLEDSNTMAENLTKITIKIEQFFNK